MLAIGLREELQKQVPVRGAYDSLDAIGAVEDGELLVDSATIDHTQLYTFIQDHPGHRITYVVDQKTQALVAFAGAHHIRLMQPEEVSAVLSETHTQSTPILAFWGVYPRLGTTTLALAVAHTLATKYNKSVGVLGLNAYNPGYGLTPDAERSLDDIQSFLKLQRLDRDSLLASMESVYRVKYLPGLRNQTQAGNLQPVQVRHLIQTAAPLFEMLVLDVGSMLNTALALEGLKMATHRYVVANDLLSTQRQFFAHENYVLKPLGITSDQLVLVGSQLHSRGTAFAKSVGLMPIASIPYFPSIDLVAEQQTDPLKLFLGEKQFRKAVEAIASAACTHTEAGGGKYDERRSAQ